MTIRDSEAPNNQSQYEEYSCLYHALNVPAHLGGSQEYRGWSAVPIRESSVVGSEDSGSGLRSLGTRHLDLRSHQWTFTPKRSSPGSAEAGVSH